MKRRFVLFSIILFAFFLTACNLVGTDAMVLTLRLSSPSDSGKVFHSFTVSGVVTGPYRITNVMIRLENENGFSEDVSAALSSSNFTADFTVSDSGVYRVWAYTTDTAGNSGTSATNRFVVSENVPIVLFMSSPSNNQRIFSNFTVSGYIGGVAEVTQVNVFVLRKTGANTYSSVTNTTNADISGIDFSADFRLTQYGTYLIWASAQAGSNQTTNSDKVLVEVTDEANSLLLSQPTTNLGIVLTNLSNITVSGELSLNSGSIEGIYVNVSNSDGVSYRKAQGIDSWSYSLSSVLGIGTNFVSVDALDFNAVSLSSVSFRIVYDKSAPVNVLDFSNNQVFTNSSVVLSGQVTDSESGVKEIFLSLDNGAFASAGKTKNWSTNLTLDEKSYSVRVYSVNSVGISSATNTLKIYCYQQAVYVTPSGSDTASGTKNEPIASIDKAVERAVLVGVQEVRIQSGTYEPGNGLNNNVSGISLTNHHISLSGGWSSDFSSKPSHSVLNGKELLEHLILIEGVSNISIDGFDIIGGKNTSGEGAGIYVNGVTELQIDNVLLSNHSANTGGAISITGSTNVLLSGVGGDFVVCDAVAAQNGGAIYISGGTNVSLKFLSVFNSHAANAGGAVYMDDTEALSILAGVFTNSYSGSDNAVIYVKGAGADVNLQISGNKIGGNGSSAVGVFEGDEVTGLELKNNVFLKTSAYLGSFYYDPSFGSVSDLADLTEVNIDGVSGGVSGNSDL